MPSLVSVTQRGFQLKLPCKLFYEKFRKLTNSNQTKSRFTLCLCLSMALSHIKLMASSHCTFALIVTHVPFERQEGCQSRISSDVIDDLLCAKKRLRITHFFVFVGA